MLRDRQVPLVVAGVGAVLFGVLAGEAVAHVVVRGEGVLDPVFVVSVLTTSPFVFACLYGGYWLRRSDLPRNRYRRIALWCVGGLAGFSLLNLATIVLLLPFDAFVLVGWLRWAAALGAGTGVAIGIVEARAIHRAVAAERARIRAESAEARSELLTYLHDLLRHKVRNAVNAIDGHASLLASQAEANGQFADAIDRQTDELVWLTQEIRVLLEASGSDADLAPLDVCTAIRRALSAVEAEFDGVDVRFECPDDAAVVADRLIYRAFRNLLVNAAVHDSGEVSRVVVDVEAADESVTVRIEDDGPGIPAHRRDGLFDLDGGGTPEKGLGLPLVRILVERYGGSIELSDTGEDGSVFTLELPRPGGRDDDPGRDPAALADPPTR